MRQHTWSLLSGSSVHARLPADANRMFHVESLSLSLDTKRTPRPRTTPHLYSRVAKTLQECEIAGRRRLSCCSAPDSTVFGSSYLAVHRLTGVVVRSGYRARHCGAGFPEPLLFTSRLYHRTCTMRDLNFICATYEFEPESVSLRACRYHTTVEGCEDAVRPSDLVSSLGHLCNTSDTQYSVIDTPFRTVAACLAAVTGGG